MNRAPFVVLLLAGIASAQPGTQPPTGTPTGTPANEPPPSGPGLGQPAPPVAGGLQLNPQELEELKGVEADYEEFLAAAKSHDARLRAIARHEFTSRTQELEKRYA